MSDEIITSSCVEISCAEASSADKKRVWTVPEQLPEWRQLPATVAQITGIPLRNIVYVQIFLVGQRLTEVTS